METRGASPKWDPEQHHRLPLQGLATWDRTPRGKHRGRHSSNHSYIPFSKPILLSTPALYKLQSYPGEIMVKICLLRKVHQNKLKKII